MKQRMFYCADCGNTWSVPFGTGRPESCVKCGSNAIHRKHNDETQAIAGRGAAFRAGTGFGGLGSCGGRRTGKNRGRGKGACNGI